MVKLDAKHNKSKVRYEDVDIEYQGQRLDNFLIRQLNGVPRSHIYRLIRSGQVRVNSGRVRANYRIKAGDRIRVPPISLNPAKTSQVSFEGVQWLGERILYEDSRVLVLDKPAGLAVHGGSGISLGCIEALRSLKSSLRQADLVHRLDRGTSGCLLIAKRRSVLRQLHMLLREKGMKKNYLALVKGKWSYGDKNVDLPLTRGSSNAREKVKVDPEGKSASTRFNVLENFGEEATMMKISIMTGRTHQIRVHAAHMRHPIAGDEQYGDFQFNAALAKKGLHRIFLHALTLEFLWPGSNEVFKVDSPLSEELKVVCSKLRS